MDKDLQEIIPILTKYEQNHLIQFYQDLDESKQRNLINQIKNTNFEFLNKLYTNSFKEDVINCKKITPINYYSKFTMDKEKEKEYIQIGEKIISNGNLAVLTLAGGMGSRLGFKGPKGSYEIDVPPKKSLFEFICDKLKVAYKKYGIYIPWYIMTSPSNDEKTKEFFLNKDYFGYPKEKIYFFTQNTINILDVNGKIILDDISELKKDSNGNGDVFRAFVNHKLDKTLKNIDWISISGVDNILLEIIDPLFIGLAAANNSSIASKSVRKDELESKEWVFANMDGKPDIIDPQLLTDEIRYSKNERGQYNYNQINILSHLFRKDAFLKAENLEIPYHRAFKKTDYINEEGMKVVPEGPNSFKFEKFIFDIFKYFEDITLLEVDKSLEFAPIKAFTGNETPENALEMYLEKRKKQCKIY